MKTKKLVLKKVGLASILWASKFYSTNMTKLKVTSRVLLITLIMYICINSTYMISASQEAGLTFVLASLASSRPRRFEGV